MLLKLPLQLRLSSSSFLMHMPLHATKTIPVPAIRYSRVIPTFSRVFPFRLRYFGLQNRAPRNEQPGLRTFSTRPSRRHGREEVRAPRSLIEDEAELSDWVSELRTDTYRGRLTSEEEDSDDNRGPIDSKGGKYPRKRRREENDAEEFGESRRRGIRSLAQSSPRKFPRASGRFVAKLEEEDEDGSDYRGKSRGSRGRTVNSLHGKTNAKKMKRRAYLTEEENDDDDGEGQGRGKDGLRRGLVDFLSEEDNDYFEEDDEGEIRKNSAGSLFLDDKEDTTKTAKYMPGESNSFMSETRFDQCSLSPFSLKGLKDAGYEKMTVVQEATLPIILKGKDVLAKAKTGTGKTVAFLLPAIEIVARAPPVDRDQKRPPIFVLVICPTRELANQAAAEANTLLKYHHSIGVQVVTGGTRLGVEQKRMQANPCQILVATPGRLRDHIENTAGFATRLLGVKLLVLDEADHLLDMGFRKDIEKILAAVPKQRQTLLFSATIPDEVRQVCHIALRRDHEFINTVPEGFQETHSQVRQTHLVAPLEKHFYLLYVLLKNHISDNVDYKVLVFCTTAMVTRLVADLLGELNLNVREIHSRKPQSYRNRVSDEFRKSKGLILVTSDVSARGVDYPDVTLVIQMGLPADREQYIHRLGRTGRKGKEGEGVLLLAPWEEFFLSTIKDLPITRAPVPLLDPDVRKKVERALSHVEVKNKESAYQSWLGFYNSQRQVGKDKHKLVMLANEFSQCMGLDQPPAIPKLILRKMGLINVPGLRSK